MLHPGITASGTKGSPVGKLWTQQTPDTTTSTYQDIEWSPSLGLYVACSTANPYIQTSPDGEVWTPRTIVTGIYMGVAWSPDLGIFIAARSTNSTWFRSTDGLSWTSVTSHNRSVNDIIWAGGSISRFIVATRIGVAGTQVIITSLNGTTWSLTGPNFAPGDGLDCVAYSPSLNRIVVMKNNGVHYKSSDAVNWLSGAFGFGLPSQTIRKIRWCDSINLFVAVGTDFVVTSSDGINWTLNTNVPAGTWTALEWSESLGLIVAISTGTNPNTMISRDGVRWYYRDSVSGYDWENVVYSPDLNQFVAVASSGPDGNLVMTSP